MKKSVIINFESMKKTEYILYGLQEFVKKENILIKMTGTQQMILHNDYTRYCGRRETKVLIDIDKLFGVDVEIIDEA